MTDRLSSSAGLLTLLLFCAAAFLHTGCSSNDSPPYFTAVVTNVYKEQATVEHFSLLYAWEERGETPFLKPYSVSAKELIVELMTPSKEDAKRVNMTTERFPFEALEEIEIELTDTGKQIKISTKDGRKITATTNFPAILKKDPAAGYADMKIFAQGKCADADKQGGYKLELSYIKKIAFTKRTGP